MQTLFQPTAKVKSTLIQGLHDIWIDYRRTQILTEIAKLNNNEINHANLKSRSVDDNFMKNTAENKPC